MRGNGRNKARLAGLFTASALILFPAAADNEDGSAANRLAEIGKGAIERGAVIGDPAAEITIYEFFDYNCGFCRRGFPAVLEMVETYPNAKVVLIDYPKLGDDSKATAGAVLDVSSADTYRVLHDELMTMSGRATRERVETLSSALSLADALPPASTATTELLDEHLAFGQAIGIKGVPTFTLDGVHQVHSIWNLEKALCGYDGPGSCDSFGVLIEDAASLAEADPEAARRFAERAAQDVTERGGASEMNMVCWDGAKARLAEAVLPACDAAVQAQSDSASIRDSRGLARALAGDTAGAIDDFEYVIARSDPGSDTASSRQAAIDALAAGDDPFSDDAYLAEF